MFYRDLPVYCISSSVLLFLFPQSNDYSIILYLVMSSTTPYVLMW